MEGQSSSHSSPMQLMPLNFCGNNNTANEVSYVPEDVQSQHVLMTSGRSWSQNELPLPMPWRIPQEPTQNYAKFLAESSALLQMNNNNPTDDMTFESLALPVSGAYALSGLSDFQIDMSYDYLGQARGSTTSAEMDVWQLGHMRPHDEDMETKFTTTQQQIQAQNHTYWTQTSNGDSHNNISRAGVANTARVASLKSPSQPRPSASPKMNTTDRQRRMRIAEKLNALQELLPNSAEGCQASILDDVIDHVKYLQLQIKDLCKSRLGGESETEAIIFHEGYGHYFCKHQMSNEPLEEMIGKLLELNPLEAIQLLEMKGLLLMPNEFTKGLV